MYPNYQLLGTMLAATKLKFNVDWQLLPDTPISVGEEI